MNDFELLEQLIAHSAKVPVERDALSGKYRVTLVEPLDPSYRNEEIKGFGMERCRSVAGGCLLYDILQGNR